MDSRTLDAYDRHAADYAQDWADQPAPDDMYALIDRYFEAGPTADVGCGCGRDAAWLASQGFDVTGFDASTALVDEARRRHPGLRFELARLPELENLPSGAYRNVLCETVIMHLAPDAISRAVTRLVELLQTGGTLYLSWRVTQGESQRDARGRLYAAFDAQRVRDALGAGVSVLFDEEASSASSGKRVHRLVVRKGAAGATGATSTSGDAS